MNGENKPLLVAADPSRDSNNDGHPSNHGNGYRKILPIIILSFLLAMSFGSTLGIVPSIMTERFASLKYNYTASCDSHVAKLAEECISASKDAQTAASASEFVSNFLTLIMSSWIGSMSDINGRRPLLILGVVCASVGPLSLLLTVLCPNVSAVFFYAAKTTNGLVHWMGISLSCIADVLPNHQRAGGVGLLMAGFWLGLCLAPSLAVFLSHTTVVVISCTMQCLGLGCAIGFVPETLPPDVATVAKEKRLYDNQQPSTLQALMRPMRELSIIFRSSFFVLLSALAFFNGMSISGDQTLLLYYVDSILSFDASDIAVMFLLVGASTVFAQAILLRPLNNCIGERWLVIVCFVTATCSNAMYGLASNKRAMYIAVCIGALSGMAFPTISAIKANSVAPSEQGRIQGALFSIQAVAGAVGPSSMRAVDALAKRNGWSAGSMFFFAALLQFVALCCACGLPRDKTNSRQQGGM